MFNVITSTQTIVNPQITTAVNNLFTVGFEAVTLLMVAGLTYGIKLGLSLIHNSIIRSFAERAVAFAENRIVGDEPKRQAVAEKISKAFPRLSQAEVDHFLEEAVTNLKAGL